MPVAVAPVGGRARRCKAAAKFLGTSRVSQPYSREVRISMLARIARALQKFKEVGGAAALWCMLRTAMGPPFVRFSCTFLHFSSKIGTC